MRINDLSAMVRRKGAPPATSHGAHHGGHNGVTPTQGRDPNPHHHHHSNGNVSSRHQTAASLPTSVKKRKVTPINRYLTVRYSEEQTVCSLQVQGEGSMLRCAMQRRDGGEPGPDQTVLSVCASKAMGAVASTLTLSASGGTSAGSASENGAETSVAGTTTLQWKVEVSCVVTCLSAAQLSEDGEGVIVVGGADGGLRLLSLRTGSPCLSAGREALVLGAAIAHCQVSACCSRVVACTLTGDVQVWELLRGSEAQSGFGLRSVVRTSVRPVVLSVRSRLALHAEIASTSDTSTKSIANGGSSRDVSRSAKKNTALPGSAAAAVEVRTCSLLPAARAPALLRVCLAVRAAGQTESREEVYTFCGEAEAWSTGAALSQ